jgi:hypothetical protein
MRVLPGPDRVVRRHRRVHGRAEPPRALRAPESVRGVVPACLLILGLNAARLIFSASGLHGEGKSLSLTRSMKMFSQCTERCKFEFSCSMCVDGQWPTPVCERWAENVSQDIYYKVRNGSDAAKVNRKRSHAHTVRFVAKHINDPILRSLVLNNTNIPMMWPDEFEFVSKTLAALKPTNYIEWGSGKSTSWYPLFASHTHVIENYPPWCRKVQGFPVVQQMIAKKRLTFHCLQPTRVDGSPVQLGTVGYPKTKIDMQALEPYIHHVSLLGVAQFDVALVDGRFRVAAALRLLEYFGPESVLIVHDFWLRAVPGATRRAYRHGPRVPGYNILLKYYFCIGRTRSVGVFKKRPVLPGNWREIYKSYMNNTW